MKQKTHIILRKCNTFKDWTIDKIFLYSPSKSRYYLEFKDLKDFPVKLIELKRKSIVRMINYPNMKKSMFDN